MISDAHSRSPVAVVTATSSRPSVGRGTGERMQPARKVSEIPDEHARRHAVEEHRAVDGDLGLGLEAVRAVGMDQSGPHLRQDPESLLPERAVLDQGVRGALATKTRSPGTR